MSSTTCQRIFAQSIIDPYNCNRIRMTSTCHNTSTQSHCIAQQQPVSTHLNGCLRTSTYSRLANKLPTNLAYTLTTTFDLSTFCTQLSSAFCYCYLFLNFFCLFLSLYFISFHLSKLRMRAASVVVVVSSKINNSQPSQSLSLPLARLRSRRVVNTTSRNRRHYQRQCCFQSCCHFICSIGCTHGPLCRAHGLSLLVVLCAKGNSSSSL